MDAKEFSGAGIAMAQRRLTTASWVAKAKAKHGNRYDYRHVDYRGSQAPVRLLCNTHNLEFHQRPSEHLRGRVGCPLCRKENCSGGPRLTLDEFVARALEVHGDRFDYSKSLYNGFTKPITIYCKAHSREFTIAQAQTHLYQKQGCEDCKTESFHRKTAVGLDVWVDRAKKRHGDRFDYSRSEYKNQNIPTEILCRKHEALGAFLISPYEHLKQDGGGCPYCGKVRTREQLLVRIAEIQPDHYTFDIGSYQGQGMRLSGYCRKHERAFSLTVNDIIQGRGCPKCGRERAGRAQASSTERFIAAARALHGDLYGYDNVDYRGSTAPVQIRCSEHGDFWQTPNTHLNGRGCQKCGIQRVSDFRRSNKEQFIASARGVHGDFYDYSRVEYQMNRIPVEIGCPIHGVFHQDPNSHLNGYGCPDCGWVAAAVTINKAKWIDHPQVAALPGLLYYIRITTPKERVFYKIGVTKHTVHVRFRDHRGKSRPLHIEVLAQWRCQMVAAVSVEQAILRKYNLDRAKGVSILSGGNRELLTRDVLDITSENAAKSKRRVRRALTKSARHWSKILGLSDDEAM